jgi:hypothetical protein
MASDSTSSPHPKDVEATADNPLAGAFFVVEKSPGVELNLGLHEYPFSLLSMAADEETAHEIRAAYDEHRSDMFEFTVRDREWLAEHLGETIVTVNALGVDS